MERGETVRRKLRLAGSRVIEFQRMEMMGIVNVTPDSFFEGSRADGAAKAMELVSKHVREGAAMIDIGGESTRPGSNPVEAAEEIQRICPVIKQVRSLYPSITISADTYRSQTAEAAIEAGAHIINDISGFTFDPDIASVIADAGAAAVVMHTGGRPDRMQESPEYGDVVEEVYGFLARQIEYGIKCGIGEDQMMIDVGIGFGKTDEHNLKLLKNIERFDDLECPHLMAVSRKSLIGRTLGALMDEGDADETAGKMIPAEERLAGTIALTSYGAMKGLEAARVHDVRENLQAARMIEAVMGRG